MNHTLTSMYLRVLVYIVHFKLGNDFFHFLYTKGERMFVLNLKIGVMRMYRCQWSGNNENMQVYHDTVWVRQNTMINVFFRKLVLDMNQAD